MILGVDTGGTFTDFVLFDGTQLRIHKVLSTPAAPEQAILQGIDEMGLRQAAAEGRLQVIHGSTVATNAALEGKGVRTAYVTNRGLADLLTIGRQQRRELFNLTATPLPAPVPAPLCLETGGRLAADGQWLEPLTDQDIQVLLQALHERQPAAVAINLLFSFLDDSAERRLEAALSERFPNLFISRSSWVLPEYKEYERGMATWLNAWLGPLVARYLDQLQQQLPRAPLAILQSSGGTMAAHTAARRAVNLLLSGPAGGLSAARYFARQLGEPALLTFDMGGTSTDVALVEPQIRLTSEGQIGPYPVAVPMVDMHTIGAGGGSIAWIDAGGMLQVGPQSAGADPGPACYGKGGTQATVTDANAVLGYLRPDAFLGGQMTLDIDAARDAVARLAQPLGLSVEACARGILAIANEHMVGALRTISVQRGFDPAPLPLCCFGGAGGLHVCHLADALGMQRALIPVHGGVLSAFGMLTAPRQRQLSRTFQQLLDTPALEQAVEQIAEPLIREGHEELQQEGVAAAAIDTQLSVELRYQGQSYTLNLPWEPVDTLREQFHELHRQRYHHRLDLPVELVTVRVAVSADPAPVELTTLPQAATPPPQWVELAESGERLALYHREQLPAGAEVVGPALIVERVSTTLVAPGWQARVHAQGSLQLERLGSRRPSSHSTY